MLVGFSGKIKSGKGTLAEVMKDEIPYGRNVIYIKKYADTLKDLLCMLTGCTRKQLEDPIFKDKYLPHEWSVYFTGPVHDAVLVTDPMYLKRIPEDRYRITYRQALQQIGTDLFRTRFHPHTWINALYSQWKPSSNWFITDVRFPDEVKAIKDRGGIVIRINRPGLPGTDLHPSETALDNYEGFDEVVTNDSTLVQFQMKGIELVSKLKLK